MNKCIYRETNLSLGHGMDCRGPLGDLRVPLKLEASTLCTGCATEIGDLITTTHS